MKSKITFSSDPCNLAEVRSTVRSFLSQCGMEECRAELLVLALDEACTNVIRYAYNKESHPVRLEMEFSRDRLKFALRDYGQSCDPKRICGRALSEIRPGGLGVHIIKHVFDRVEYRPMPRGTKLVLEMLIPQESAPKEGLPRRSGVGH